MVYWEGQRGNYFIDEIFSIEKAKTIAHDDDTYILDRESWTVGSWMDADEILSQIEITRQDSLLSQPVSESLRLLTTKRSYSGLLNIALTSAGSLEESYSRAMALNILFLIISELLLAFCIKTMTRSKSIAVMSVIMFGFSAIIVCMCTYIRFYMLTIMLLMIVTVCHLKLWNAEHKVYFLALELIAFFTAYLGLLNSELMLVTCGSLFCFFFAALLIRKRFPNALIYAVPLLAGMYRFVNQQTDLLQVVFHPSQFAEAGMHGKAAVTYNLINLTPEAAKNAITQSAYAVTTKQKSNAVSGCHFRTDENR